MLDINTNFENLYDNNLICRTFRKEDSIEDEDHILNCESLVSERDKNIPVKFNYVYKDIKHQKIAVDQFKAVIRKREILLE